jgi:hypothetical protein
MSRLRFGVTGGLPSAPSARRAVRPWPGSGHRRWVTEGALDRRGVPAVGAWGWRGSLAAGGRRPRPAALALGTHGAGRRRSAVPCTRRPAVPAVTHSADRACQSGGAVLPRRAILSPRMLAVKGATACGLRVPPLRSGQTPDSELPRQDRHLPGGQGNSRFARARVGHAGHSHDTRIEYSDTTRDAIADPAGLSSRWLRQRAP